VHEVLGVLGKMAKSYRTDRYRLSVIYHYCW